MTFQFYTSTEQYLETFYQLPKVFFENSIYKSMSNDSKIAYAILKDRFNYSIKNNWIDEQDRIYFIFTNKELEKILNLSTKTVIKVKKELINLNLLHQEYQGLNKANRLFLGKPQIEANNSYKKQAETLDNKGSGNFTPPLKQAETLDNKGSGNFTPNLYINHLDTLQDTLLDTGNNSIDLENYAKQIESEIDKSQTNSIPEPAKQTLLTFSANNYKIVEDQIGMIYRAKKEVAAKYNVLLLIENDEWGFINAIKTISLAIYKDKKSIHKIKNYDNYFYISIKKYFEQQAERINFKQEIENEELPPIPMTNWFEN